MPFPDSPCVIYANNPLVEVVCQLRFPPILRIDSELPAALQEKIRGEYPLFRENKLTEWRVDLPSEVVQLSGGALPPTVRAGKVAYDFLSADEQWKVGLTCDFIALTTASYERWEGFKTHLTLPLRSFIEIYSPPFFSRLGLRYRDVIRPSQLGLEGVLWSELLQPHIAGELAADQTIVQQIKGVAKQIHLLLPDDAGEVLMQHGFVQHEEGEICYLIDSDFSINVRTEVSDAIRKLDAFNQKSRRLFRWCITERLHKAMEPQPL